VQQLGLEILMEVADREKVEAVIEQRRLALVSHDPDAYMHLLDPDKKSDDEEEDEEVLKIQIGGDEELAEEMDQEGAWDFTKSGISPEMAASILGGQSNVPVTSDFANVRGKGTPEEGSDIEVIDRLEQEFYDDGKRWS
jgi:hypothetical protein